MAALQNFRRKACVDWVDVRLRIARPTQFQHVQSALEAAGAGKRHVRAIDDGPGGVADTFVVRVTDRLANNYAALSKALAVFAVRYVTDRRNGAGEDRRKCATWKGSETQFRTGSSMLVFGPFFNA
jgi:hypothetical protein